MPQTPEVVFFDQTGETIVESFPFDFDYVTDAAGECFEDPNGGAQQDPHLHFAHGGRADFRGQHGAYYNFFSAPGLAVNVKTEDATFMLHNGKLTVDGSFITEAHLVARVGGAKRKWANLSFWASELNRENWGWRVVNGSCGGHAFNLGKGGSRQCEELRMAVDMASATFSLRNWTLLVRGNNVFDRLSGPEHRLDLTFSSRGDAAGRDLPHGIIGQSFSSTAPRYGMTDEYPDEGRFKTSAMAEGAIEGEAAMYEMAWPHATDFTFSRFEALGRAETATELAAARDATSAN